MNEKVRSVLNTIVENFRSGDIPRGRGHCQLSHPGHPQRQVVLYQPHVDVPLRDSFDARGFQAMEVRSTAGSKKAPEAIYILVPCMKTQIDEETGEQKETLRYFKASPVFACEDTEGRTAELRAGRACLNCHSWKGLTHW